MLLLSIVGVVVGHHYGTTVIPRRYRLGTAAVSSDPCQSALFALRDAVRMSVGRAADANLADRADLDTANPTLQERPSGRRRRRWMCDA
jgi:hypothetical protein